MNNVTCVYSHKTGKVAVINFETKFGAVLTKKVSLDKVRKYVSDMFPDNNIIAVIELSDKECNCVFEGQAKHCHDKCTYRSSVELKVHHE